MTTKSTTTLADARAELERSRARVEASVTALRDEVDRRRDWRGWVRQRPGLFLAGALALGFLWGRAGHEVQKTDGRT
jgi:hypothetical protein